MLQMKNEVWPEPTMANTTMFPIRHPIFTLAFSINHSCVNTIKAICFNLRKKYFVTYFEEEKAYKIYFTLFSSKNFESSTGPSMTK